MPNTKKMDFKPSLQEQELVAGCIRDDRKCQKGLFDKYKDAIYTAVFRILRHEETASDALQEGFINVFGDLKNFAGRSTLGAWIKVIMVRSALRYTLKKNIYARKNDKDRI
jgi:DNA-directed RNA polymerase specialized sigma24 family protein